MKNYTYILTMGFLWSLAFAAVLSGDAGAHPPEECACECPVCPEPPPPPMMVCADGSDPMPVISVPEDADPAPRPVPQAVQDALKAIDKYEQYEQKKAEEKAE
jgi:hypothetical protein